MLSVFVKSVIYLIAVPWQIIYFFSWVAFNIILSLTFLILLTCVQIWIYFIFPDQHLCFVNVKINIFHHIWKPVRRFFKSFYLFICRQRGGREEERGRNISVWLPLMCPYWGPGPQSRHMPLLGTELVTLWFTGWHSIYWATSAMENMGNHSKHGKCGSAPTQKSQWGASLAGRTHVHG